VRRLALLLALLAGLVVAGCGFGAGETTDEVTLTVSRDFGRARLEPVKTDRAREGDTVMRLLQRDFDVDTRYGGGFVQEIDGISGGLEGGRRVDWFYYVNGIEADVGAAQRRVHPGDRIWWDHHDWSAAMHVPAVVGAFPEPFLSGEAGKKIPVRLVCLGDQQRSCNEVETRLEDAGVKAISRASLPQSFGREILRIIVGRWSDVRADAAARRLEQGPRASGVFARPTADGRRIDLLDAQGRVVRGLTRGAGLVAATELPGFPPTWIATGTDDVGVAAAAAALTEDGLRDSFALAVDDGRGVPLPVAER
jgi:Domain of unknown function (DUF4430)